MSGRAGPIEVIEEVGIFARQWPKTVAAISAARTAGIDVRVGEPGGCGLLLMVRAELGWLTVAASVAPGASDERIARAIRSLVEHLVSTTQP